MTVRRGVDANGVMWVAAPGGGVFMISFYVYEKGPRA